MQHGMGSELGGADWCCWDEPARLSKKKPRRLRRWKRRAARAARRGDSMEVRRARAAVQQSISGVLGWHLGKHLARGVGGTVEEAAPMLGMMAGQWLARRFGAMATAEVPSAAAPLPAWGSQLELGL